MGDAAASHANSRLSLNKIRGEIPFTSGYQTLDCLTGIAMRESDKDITQQTERIMISPGDLVVFVFAVGVVLTYVSFLRKFINAAENEKAPQHA